MENQIILKHRKQTMREDCWVVNDQDYYYSCLYLNFAKDRRSRAIELHNCLHFEYMSASHYAAKNRTV